MLCDVRTSLVVVASLTCLVLLTCVRHTSAFVHRGCAYRAVVGKKQAVLFCLADNLCAMLRCRDNDVFSPRDCGCVTPPSTSSPSSLPTTPPPPSSSSSPPPSSSFPPSPSPSSGTETSSSATGGGGVGGGVGISDVNSTAGSGQNGVGDSGGGGGGGGGGGTDSSSGSGSGFGSGFGSGASSSLSSSSPSPSSASSSLSSGVVTTSIILSACLSGVSTTTTTTSTTMPTSSTTITTTTSASKATCPAEIHIDGLSARSPSTTTTTSIAIGGTSNGGKRNSGNDSSSTSSLSSSSSSTTTTSPTASSSSNSISAGGGSTFPLSPRGVVDVGNGSLWYDGYARLALPTYSNARFESGLSVSFLVEEGASPLRQVLMTNCYHGQGASVEILLDAELGVVVFHVMYRFRHALNAVETSLRLTVPYTASVPKRVALVFDGHHLTGRVNDSQKSARVQGNGDYILSQRRKPFLFGNTMCDLDTIYSYRGKIGQISIYRCAKPMSELFS